MKCRGVVANKEELFSHLRDGAHSELVEGSGEESSKGGAEGDGSVTTGNTNGNTNQILLCNEAFDVPATTEHS